MQKTIVFQVFDWEKVGKAEVIGEVDHENHKNKNFHIHCLSFRYKFLSGN